MIDTVLWDVDATLLNFKKSERKSLMTCFAKYQVFLTGEQFAAYQRINHAYWQKLEAGQISREDVLIGRYVDFFKIIDVHHIDPVVFNKEYQEALATYFYVEEGALEIVTLLAKRQIRQFVVSNGSKIAQMGKLEGSGLMPYMEACFISEDLGYEKPDAHFFQIVKERTAYQEERTLLIGDSLTSDIAGGYQAGIKTCWFNPEKQENTTGIAADFEITSLYDVAQIVKEA